MSWYLAKSSEKVLDGPGTVLGVSSLLIQNKRETEGLWWAAARQGREDPTQRDRIWRSPVNNVAGRRREA